MYLFSLFNNPFIGYLTGLFSISLCFNTFIISELKINNYLATKELQFINIGTYLLYKGASE